MAELHRTQVWRALALLEERPAGRADRRQRPQQRPVLAERRPVGRLPLRDRRRARRWRRARRLAGPAASGARARGRASAAAGLCRGAGPRRFPARSRRALSRSARGAASAGAPAEGDAAAAAALGLRRARIARRLGDWAALQDELRELGHALNNARLPRAERRQLRARVAILAAWHWYGSLGQPAAALDKLEEVDPDVLAADPMLRCDHGNLRGIVLRELAVARGDAALAAQAIASLGDALRSASLSGLPDALQVCAANLAHTLGQLVEAGLLAEGGPGPSDALRWLLLSDAMCARWQLGRSSLLNTIFLLRLAAFARMDFKTLQRLASAEGLPLPASSHGELAERAGPHAGLGIRRSRPISAALSCCCGRGMRSTRRRLQRHGPRAPSAPARAQAARRAGSTPLLGRRGGVDAGLAPRLIAWRTAAFRATAPRPRHARPQGMRPGSWTILAARLPSGNGTDQPRSRWMPR
ncbi:hypothetical protein Ddc_19766 [Ditylenchus destructor]|nr:hypothetical protein Ddc_19766 [Ditylenchus destructor]